VEKMTQFTVQRSKWLHGEGCTNSRLLRFGDQKMCCLGFLGQACGIRKMSMLGIGTPAELEDQEIWPNGIISNIKTSTGKLNNSDICGMIMEVNDTINFPNREQKLQELFATIGIQVSFED
jgi:hypothetical protein